MAEYDLIVLNGLVVTHEETGELDIAIRDGKIAKLVPRGSFSGITATKILDAEGGMICPGGVDAHVHLGRLQTPLL